MVQTLIQTALGNEKGDLLLKNGNIVDIFCGTVEKADILIKNGFITRCGKIDDSAAEKVEDMNGSYLLPGFIDAHVHIESSHMTPRAFGHAVLAKGTTAVIADPHEIANVAGEKGLDFMIEDAKHSPMDIFYMLPSSVPATDKETAGATLTAADTAKLLKEHPEFLGLGEVMNVPGVLFGDPETQGKLNSAAHRAVDGHFPCGSGKELAAYACAGISSDHECVTAEEAAEKLKNGLTVYLREGSSAKNLCDLLPVVNDHNHSRCCFCADDICATDILDHGDMLNCVRKAVQNGMDALRAVEMATINVADHYHLKDRGALAPGRLADIIAVKDLNNFEILGVWKNGISYNKAEEKPTSRSFGTFSVPKKELSFPVPEKGEANARVIRVFPGQLITEEVICPVSELSERNAAPLFVLERYGKNGNIGCAFAEGFGIKEGAIASSIAHDSHNLLILAADEKDAAFAAETMEKMGGGMLVVKNGKVKAALELPVGGLMCDLPAAEVAEKEQALTTAAKELGITIESPFMTLSFMALPVIPKLKLTDKGLFDTELFDFVPLFF